MNTLSDYLFNFANLRCSPSKLGVAPHKPILLLAVIDLFEKELVSGAYIEISSALEHAFSQQWDNYVKSAHQKRLATPFYHLSNEGFWTLDTHPNFDEIVPVNYFQTTPKRVLLKNCRSFSTGLR